MFFLATRNRPDAVKNLILAMRDTETPEMAVMIDGDPELYKDVPWPSNWRIHSSKEHLESVAAYNELFKLYPNEKFYGEICDHAVPRSKNWATELAKAAGDWNVACCKGSRFQFRPDTGKRPMSAASAKGGELVRALGWLRPPYLIHIYEDNIWEDIAHGCKIYKYCSHVNVGDLSVKLGEFRADESHLRMYKGESYVEKDEAAYKEIWKPKQEETIKMLISKIKRDKITFVCVQSGNYLGKGAEYVNILFDSITRNLPGDVAFTFVCYTDDDSNLSGNVTTRPLKEGIKGWWNKLYLFKKGEFASDERVIYFDLDTVITGALDDIIEYNGDFALLRDFYHPRFAPGMMLWRGGYGHEIWDCYEKAGYPTDLPLGDLDWINNWINENDITPDVIQSLFKKQVGSFKIEARYDIPKGMRVVCFHGLPRPHEVQNGWVEEVWKIGGASTAEFQVVCNNSDDILVKNIFKTLNSGLPKLQMENPHKGVAVLVGGGPSLKNELGMIRALSESGAIVFSMNNSHKFLKENGITADCHVMLDSRVENIEFVPRLTTCYYCSHYAPEVFERAKENKNNVIVYHHFARGIWEIIGENTGDPLVGGISVGMTSLALAFTLGYRNFHLFGFDSSYVDEHHAYPQPINDAQRVIDVVMNGKKYITSPWMVTQYEEFKEMAPQIIENGGEIHVYGSGLLPDGAALMTFPENAVAENRESVYNSPETRKAVHV